MIFLRRWVGLTRRATQPDLFVQGEEKNNNKKQKNKVNSLQRQHQCPNIKRNTIDNLSDFPCIEIMID